MLSYLAQQGYYKRGYKDAWAGLVRYEKYRNRKRYVHRVCVDCGDERDVIENSHPSVRCPTCARIRENKRRSKKKNEQRKERLRTTGFMVTYQRRGKTLVNRFPDKDSIDRLAESANIINIVPLKKEGNP